MDGEAVLTSGDGVGVGKNIHYINGRFDYHQRVYAVFDFSDSLNGEFFFQYFREHFLKRVMRMSAKNSVDSVRMAMIADMVVPVPSRSEQEKIAAFLGAVDEKIAGLEKKKALLEDYKRGVMHKLFSQELRFKDDQGRDFPDWEEKRLGDVVRFIKGRGVAKNDIVEDGTTPCIRYGEIYTEYREMISSVISSTNRSSDELLLSEKGDVIIPASGEDRMDMARACCVDLEGVALGGDINVLRGAENGLFLAYYLNNAKRREIANVAQGVSVVHLYPSQLSSISIALPNPAEQQKIASFLASIDSQIGHVESEIAGAKAFKKGLLQQMFV